MRRILVIACLWLLAGRAQASGQLSLLAAANLGAPSNSATQYIAPASSGAVWSATEANVEDLFGGTGTWSLASWSVYLSAAPGGSASWTFTVRKNEVDTALTVTISAAATTGSDTTHSATFAPGDRISISCVPASTPTTTGLRPGWCFKATAPSANQQPMLWGNGTALAANTTGYTTPQGTVTSTTEADEQWPVPTGGTISALYAYLTADPGNGNTAAITFRKAGSDQTLTCTVTGNGTNGQTANDTTHSFSVAAGDLINVKYVTSATFSNTPRLRWGAVFAPTTGSFTVLFGGFNTEAQTSTVFYSVIGASSATETQTQVPLWACTVKNLYLDSSSNLPVATKSLTMTVDKATVAQTITTQATNGAPTSHDTTHTASFSDGDLLSVSGANTSTSGTVAPKFSLVLDVTQPAAGGNPAGSGLLTGVGALPPSMRRTRPGGSLERLNRVHRRLHRGFDVPRRIGDHDVVGLVPHVGARAVCSGKSQPLNGDPRRALRVISSVEDATRATADTDVVAVCCGASPAVNDQHIPGKAELRRRGNGQVGVPDLPCPPLPQSGFTSGKTDCGRQISRGLRRRFSRPERALPQFRGPHRYRVVRPPKTCRSDYEHYPSGQVDGGQCQKREIARKRLQVVHLWSPFHSNASALSAVRFRSLTI